MDLVDEEDGLLALVERRDEGLEALLEVAAVARSRQQRAQVEGEDLGVLQVLGHAPLVDPQREPLGQRRLPDAGLADEDRVVLAAAGEDLGDAVELPPAPDQRIELPAAARSVRSSA